MNGGWWLWIGLGCGAAGGLLSSLQHALREVSRASLEQAITRRRSAAGVRSGGGAATAAAGPEDLLSEATCAVAADLDGHVAAVALPRIACNLLLGVSVVLWVAHLGDAVAPRFSDVAIGIAAAGSLTWVLSVVVPLALARHAAERTVLSWVWLIRVCYLVLRPLRSVLGFVAEVVRRLAGTDAVDEMEAREAELLSLVEESEREGQLDETAREMIEAVVEFRSTTVEQIMTPRTEVEALEYTDDLELVKRHAAAAAHSRIPVYREDLDHIVGVLYIKDLLRWLVTADQVKRPFVLSALLRQPWFVPETKTVRELLGELLEQKVHLAVAIDEYGGTSGLVTIEDIVEEVFGEIQDEYDEDEPETTGVEIDAGSGVARIDARTEIDEANDELTELGLELPEDDDYDTVGGFVVTRLGRIPAAGDELRHEDLVVTVLEAEPTRVVRVAVRRATEEERTPVGV